MDVLNQIKFDLIDALSKAYPGGDVHVEDFRGRLFVTVLDKEANEVGDEQILRVLREAHERAVLNKERDDRLWRSLATGIREVEDAEAARVWRKEWEAGKNDAPTPEPPGRPVEKGSGGEFKAVI